MMWAGGVRVAVTDEEGRLLLVKQRHEGADIWMLPGGAIEDGEDAISAAKREMIEETGLLTEPERLLWHVEEVSPARGQRFVNFFAARIVGGTAALGSDPEFDAAGQVLRELRFFTRAEVAALPRVYPESLRDALWEALDETPAHEVFALRD